MDSLYNDGLYPDIDERSVLSNAFAMTRRIAHLAVLRMGRENQQLLNRSHCREMS